MNHEIFGDITFNTGWKAKRNIKLFGKEYPINLKIKAYYEQDGITKEQENAYLEFYKCKDENIKMISKLLIDYSNSEVERYIPRTLLIDRNGEIALLCDDKEEPDEGIAVCVYPEAKVLLQDEYL